MKTKGQSTPAPSTTRSLIGSGKTTVPGSAKSVDTASANTLVIKPLSVATLAFISIHRGSVGLSTVGSAGC
jgi:hypothetical protein